MGRKREGRTISKPILASIMSRTRSATLPISIIEFKSLLHSMNVNRRSFPISVEQNVSYASSSISLPVQVSPETTVTQPFTSPILIFVYLLTRLFRSVVLPTPDGPTIATMIGGAEVSVGVRLISGTCSRVWACSAVRRPWRAALRPDLGAKAWGRARIVQQAGSCQDKRIQ